MGKRGFDEWFMSKSSGHLSRYDEIVHNIPDHIILILS